ncbi:hypothetical protein RRG08_005321 [Elysia crispata]|uniref:Uncharacterized protein n=1 Tax=Elysia crispata TaxID=231223 RepID=A0AAE1D7H3_9GAST|nr:hypothetical protein RRG08_005321 [Elysia crispata]
MVPKPSTSDTLEDKIKTAIDLPHKSQVVNTRCRQPASQAKCPRSRSRRVRLSLRRLPAGVKRVEHIQLVPSPTRLSAQQAAETEMMTRHAPGDGPLSRDATQSTSTEVFDRSCVGYFNSLAHSRNKRNTTRTGASLYKCVFVFSDTW